MGALNLRREGGSIGADPSRSFRPKRGCPFRRGFSGPRRSSSVLYRLVPRFLAWRVFRLSESPCTEIGLRWQVSRLSEPSCRQFDTATRETCRRNPETRARRRSNSGNLPRGARNAARRPANSENLPARRRRLQKLGKPAQSKGGLLRKIGKPANQKAAATATRKTCPVKRGPATLTRETRQSRKLATETRKTRQPQEGPATLTRKTCQPGEPGPQKPFGMHPSGRIHRPYPPTTSAGPHPSSALAVRIHRPYSLNFVGFHAFGQVERLLLFVDVELGIQTAHMGANGVFRHHKLFGDARYPAMSAVRRCTLPGDARYRVAVANWNVPASFVIRAAILKRNTDNSVSRGRARQGALSDM